jgi:homoserine kinase type II
MDRVFVLQHVARENTSEEDVKFIGVYSTRESAEAAVQRLLDKPGFRDDSEGFHIDEYSLDEDHWPEGFVTVPVHSPQ